MSVGTDGAVEVAALGGNRQDLAAIAAGGGRLTAWQPASRTPVGEPA